MHRADPKSKECRNGKHISPLPALRLLPFPTHLGSFVLVDAESHPPRRSSRRGLLLLDRLGPRRIDRALGRLSPRPRLFPLLKQSDSAFLLTPEEGARARGVWGVRLTVRCLGVLLHVFRRLSENLREKVPLVSWFATPCSCYEQKNYWYIGSLVITAAAKMSLCAPRCYSPPSKTPGSDVRKPAIPHHRTFLAAISPQNLASLCSIESKASPASASTTRPPSPAR